MEVINTLKELLRFKSITPKDDGAFNYISMLMSDFETVNFDKNGTKNLLLSKKFGDGVNLCFAGHIDVVLGGENWDSNPFEPITKDGFIYARGAQDMKSGVAAMLCACKNTTEFNGTLSILLTSDEEGDGNYGTKYALEEMQKLNLLPDCVVIAEPTCENVFGDTIKVGRKGSINGILDIKGVQGHAAYPEKCVNPVHEIAKILPNFAGYDLDAGNEQFSPSKIVITDIRGGSEATNVTPSNIKMMFNVRNSNLSNANDLKNYCERVFAGLDYTLELKINSDPFLTDKNSQIVKNLSQIIEEKCGFSPKFSTSGGTSDARFFSANNISVVEFGVKNDTIHAANEKVAIDEVIGLYEIFVGLIKNFNKS